MCLRARVVLMDCKIALEILEDSENVRHWRIHWAGAISLLRAVGSVLRHVDRKHPQFREAIDRRYEIWKQEENSHNVFWDFIKKERDNLLKEYGSSISDADAIPLGITSDLGENGSLEIFELGENLFRPVLKGYGENEDARDVYHEALDWWERELSLIEKSAAEIT